MAVYNVNQNRQLYVVKQAALATTTPTTEGQLQLVTSKDKKQLCFKHVGKGGLTRTDLIDVDNICYVKFTPKEKLQRKTKKAVVKLSPDVNGGVPVLGQDYVLRIQINNYIGSGDACVLIKSSAVHATKAMTGENGAKAFYDKFAEILTKSFSRESPALLTFEGTADGLVIKEAPDQPWRLGVMSQAPVNFEVFASTITCDGDEVVWAELDPETQTIKVEEDADGVVIPNSKDIADLEYFCMGERGDMFRNMGWPNNIDVKYMVNPDAENGYDVIDIHYFYSGSGVQVHKSEKDLTFVSATTGAMGNLKTALEAIEGITVETV